MDSFDQAQQKRQKNDRDKKYGQYVEQKTPPSDLLRNILCTQGKGGQG